jgi:hypothetical protein
MWAVPVGLSSLAEVDSLVPRFSMVHSRQKNNAAVLPLFTLRVGCEGSAFRIH